MKIIAALTALALLAGCAELGAAYNFANNATREGVATAIVLQCTTKLSQARASDLADINARVAAKGSMARMLALDCNNDGQPDF